MNLIQVNACYTSDYYQIKICIELHFFLHIGYLNYYCIFIASKFIHQAFKFKVLLFSQLLKYSKSYSRIFQKYC
uniref:Em1-tg6 n=1 Tax=Euplotes aediculatus TaxID=5940 RepID=Q1PPX7_EUPAE|nr:em1-tg6 [Euplotes aediculatus]